MRFPYYPSDVLNFISDISFLFPLFPTSLYFCSSPQPSINKYLFYFPFLMKTICHQHSSSIRLFYILPLWLCGCSLVIIDVPTNIHIQQNNVPYLLYHSQLPQSVKQDNSARTGKLMQTHNKEAKLTKTSCQWTNSTVINDAHYQPNHNLQAATARFKRPNQKRSRGSLISLTL